MDQAEGLRDLFKTVNGGIFEDMGIIVKDQDPIDYKKLWNDLKSNLDFETTHHDFTVKRKSDFDYETVETKSAKFARKALGRMNQFEDIERFKAKL